MDLKQLVQQAGKDGILSPDASRLYQSDSNLVAQLAAGLGAPAESFRGRKAMIAPLILDDSQSISWVTNDPNDQNSLTGPEMICEGQKIFIETFKKSKKADSILFGTWLIYQDDPVHGFMNVKDLKDSQILVPGVNYHANGMTPLYKRICIVLDTVLIKMDVELAKKGKDSVVFLNVVSDGKNEIEQFAQGKIYTAEDVRTRLEDLGERCISNFVGIHGPGGYQIDFRAEAREMGFKNCSEVSATPSEIRKIFQLSSQAVDHSTQSDANFDKLATDGLGGFGQ